jgi:hypothetical protein
MANLIAPLNESFVDFDAWRRRTQRRSKSPASGHYAEMVREARR